MIIGLTGSIGSGKSEAAKIFKSLGAYIIDADKVSHSISSKNADVLKELSKVFGNSILNNRGYLNRNKLGEIVFNDKNKRLKLEKILHSKIIEKIKALAKAHCKMNIIIDAPLLFETNLHKICDRVITVTIPKDIQIKRLQRDRKLSQEQIEQRLKAQIPQNKKINLSDYIIDNSKDKHSLKNQVIKLYRTIAITTLPSTTSSCPL